MGEALQSDYTPFCEGFWIAIRYIDFHLEVGECAVTVKMTNFVNLYDATTTRSIGNILEDRWNTPYHICPRMTERHGRLKWMKSSKKMLDPIPML